MSVPVTDTLVKPGIYRNVPNEDYHSGPGISKSGLWTIHDKSPAHYRHPHKPEETTQSKAIKDFGTAAHTAILEPNDFDTKVYRGPADRRGDKWTNAEEYCKAESKVLLTAGDFDKVLAIRDAVHANPFVNGIITGGNPLIEASGYWIDEETGELCRCRPDLYRGDLGIIVDIKTAQSAHPNDFARSVVNYGYHAQEAHYSDGWKALGRDVQGFVFIAWEKKSPFACGVYELPPAIVDEGRAIIRKSLQTYHECRKADRWPAYGDGVQELPISRWAYRLTEAPREEEAEAA